MKNKEYFAFISYQRQDEEWAKWLAHELEHYHLPVTLNGREDLPKNLRPIFRDIDELAAGNLPKQIHQALENSKHLIVVCSPRSAKSKWVNKEVEEFIKMGRTDEIYPYIIDGVAMSEDPDKECFPPALRNLPKEDERLGGNINEKGRDAAVVKIVAGMLNLGFDTLWQRYEREKADEERKTREQRDNLLKIQSRFLAEQSKTLANNGDSYMARILALEALPQKMENPDRPYIQEAEIALRYAMTYENAILKGHTDKVMSVSYCRNGHRIASGSFDSTIRVWDALTGQCVQQIETKKCPIMALAFSPDGNNIAYAYAPLGLQEDNAIYIWNLTKNSYQCVLKGHRHMVRSISYSFDGKYLASASHDGNIRIWDVESEQCTQVLTGDGTSMFSVIFSPVDNRFVAGSFGKVVQIWNASNGNIIQTLHGHLDFVTNVSYSPDGKSLLSASEDKTGRIWNTENWQCQNILKGHSAFVLSAIYSPDGQFVVSGSLDKSIRIWDAETGSCLTSLEGHSDRVNSLSVCSKNGLFVSASDDATIRIWDLYGTYPQIVSLADVLWNKNSHNSSDGKKFACLEERRGVCLKENETGRVLFEGHGHTDDINCMRISSDDKFLASASWDKTIRIWDMENGECLQILKGHTECVMSADFSPDCQLIVSSSLDNTIKIWDVHSGKCLQSIDNQYHSPAYFTLDGWHVASISDDDHAYVWEFLPIQKLIDKNHERFKNRQLTLEERKVYYLD